MGVNLRIAVTGSQGQVARSLIERAEQTGADVIALARPLLDLAEPSTIFPALASAAPDVVVNAAAYTAVDKAESEEPLAFAINCVGAASVAEAARRIGVPVIHLSTDYVFDGALDRPYREDDPTGPLNAYGRSKLAGERAVMAANPRCVVLRVSSVYSPFGVNFVKTMLRLGKTRDRIGVVADQVAQPTSALDIASVILEICRVLALGEEPRMFGIFHAAGDGAANWAEFAEAIFAETTARGGRKIQVARITASEYPTAARRPANSRLDTQKLAGVYGVVLPSWRASLPRALERLVGED